MKQAFDSILTRTEQERQNLINELKALYNGATEDNANTLNDYRQNRRHSGKRQAYFESCQRVGAFIDVFELLGITEEITGFNMEVTAEESEEIPQF